MRLRLIIELKLYRAIDKVKPLLDTIPKKKKVHSTNVARTLNKSKAGKIGVYAGLLHDYLENGGSLTHLSDHISELGLPPEIIKLVHSLSSDEKDSGIDNSPLRHLQQVVPTIADPDLVNILVLVKLSDRIDNLIKRKRAKKIGRNYRQKSVELYDYLKSIYNGEKKPFKILSRKFGKLLG